MAIGAILGVIMRFVGGSAARGAAVSVGESIAAEEALDGGGGDATAELEKFLEKKAEAAERGLHLSLQQSANIVRAEVVRAIKEVDAVASGNLLESVTIGSLVPSTEQPSITVGSSAPYAVFVEEGVRPGGRQPPTDKIYQWMISRGMEPSMSGAYLIGKRIRERGIKGRHPFQIGTDRAFSQVLKTSEITIANEINKDE